MEYKVLGNLKADKEYVAGDVIELEEEEAKVLLENGDIEKIGAEGEPEGEPEEVKISTLKLDELKSLAEERKVDIEGLKTRADIIEALEEAEENEEEEEKENEKGEEEKAGEEAEEEI